LGFPDALLKQMGEGLTANSSMLVALVDEGSVVRASEVIAQAGGTLMGTSQETDLAAAMDNLRRG
jgi:riboflavin biosynthesis pyrimidine reductase